jgi:hypothetical protein
MSKMILSIGVLLLSSVCIFAQQSKVKVEPVFAGVAPTALKLPVPETGTRGWGASGVISVGIIVNELGSVSVTDDGEGPYPRLQECYRSPNYGAQGASR